MNIILGGVDSGMPPQHQQGMHHLFQRDWTVCSEACYPFWRFDSQTYLHWELRRPMWLFQYERESSLWRLRRLSSALRKFMRNLAMVDDCEKEVQTKSVFFYSKPAYFNLYLVKQPHCWFRDNFFPTLAPPNSFICNQNKYKHHDNMPNYS